jgi:hypothetical protein
MPGTTFDGTGGLNVKAMIYIIFLISIAIAMTPVMEGWAKRKIKNQSYRVK